MGTTMIQGELWGHAFQNWTIPKALRAAGKEKLKLAILEVNEQYRLEDSTIHIQPNVFKVVVANLGDIS